MKTKADKHREAGTLDAFRARQAASRAGTARWQQQLWDAPREPTLEERVAFLELLVAELWEKS
jgi:hypothetical protein